MSADYALETFDRITSMWEENRRFFLKAMPKFSSNGEQRKKSFLRFKRNQLRYFFDERTLSSMTEEKAEIEFRKIYKGRRVTHYDHRIKDGRIILSETYKFLPKGRLSDMNGRIRPEVREALLIKPSKTALLKGVVPFRYGCAPVKINHMEPKFFNYMTNRASDTHKSQYDPQYNDRVSVSGSWGAQWRDFQDACDDTTHKMSYERIRKAIARRFKGKLKLPYFKEGVDPSDCLRVETNPRASSGLMSGKFFGQKHVDADKHLRPLACEVSKLARNRIIADCSLWTIGGRDRRQKIHKDGPLRSRIIMMPDGLPKIIGLSYASKIYDGLSRINYGKYSNECQLGRNDFHGNFIKYTDYFMKQKGINVLEADISKHDVNTNEKTLVAAFALVRSCYPPSDETDRMFMYMMSGTIFKNVVIPGRFIYKLTKSIPSGTPFTSIVTTLVNWINWSAVIVNNWLDFLNNEFHLNLFGDDTILSLPDYVDRTEEWWIQEFKSICGYDLDPCKILSFHDPVWYNRPSFLKTMPNYGLPARLTKDMFISLSFTRKRNKGWAGYYQQATVMCYSAPFNFDLIDFALDVRNWCTNYIYPETPMLNAFERNPARQRKNDNITYKLLSRNYLCPRVYGHDVTKNVDLGNKPKVVQPGYNIKYTNVPTAFRNLFIYEYNNAR